MFSPFHYISKNCIALKQYPTATIPVTHINVNIINNLGLIAFLNKIKEGILKVVTLIINERTTPSLAPFDNKASAMGMHQKYPHTLERLQLQQEKH